MVESVYRHNKTWQFIRRPCDTFVPRAHCLPRRCSPYPRGGWEGEAELLWISDLALKCLALSRRSQEIKAWAALAPVALNNTSRLFCVHLDTHSYLSRKVNGATETQKPPTGHKEGGSVRFADATEFWGTVKATVFSWQLPLGLTSTSSSRSTVSVGGCHSGGGSAPSTHHLGQTWANYSQEAIYCTPTLKK